MSQDVERLHLSLYVCLSLSLPLSPPIRERYAVGRQEIQVTLMELCINHQQMQLNYNMYFIYYILINMFRPVVRPSSG
jgi:hypothetical protein